MQKQWNTTDEKLLYQLRACGHFLRFHAGGKGGQRRILRLLDQEGGMSQRALMERLDVRSGSLSEILAKIEEQGLIVRTQSEEDKRGMEIALTEAGKAMAEQARTQHAERVQTMFAGLSDEEKEQLASLLDKLVGRWAEERQAEHSHHRGHGHEHCPCKGHAHGERHHHRPHDL